jgi:hypothetical protein
MMGMNFKSLVAQLVNCINQLHMIRVYFRQVYMQKVL